MRPPSDVDRFASFCAKYGRHVKGSLAGQPVVFEPWQYEDWRLALEVDPRTGLRVFKNVVFMRPKKHSKSLDSALAGYYMMSPFDGENGPEGYCAAGSKDQARIVLDVARTMIDPESRSSSPLLCDIFQRYRSHIACKRNDGVWRVVAHDSDLVEGANPHFVSCDEYAVHKTPTLRDNLRTAMIARQQPFMLTISTVGDNTDRPLYQLEQAALKLRDVQRDGYRTVAMDRDAGFLFIRYGLDEDDDCDIEDPAVLNGVNVASWITTKALLEILHDSSTTEAAFRRKHLNQWVAVAEQGIDPSMWDGCESDVRLEQGQEVCIGVDLAVRRDWCAVVVAGMVGDRIVLEQRLFPPPADGDIDIRATVDDAVGQMMQRYRVQRIGMDKYGDFTLMQDWQRRQWPVEDFPMFDSSFCPASVEFHEAVRLGRLAHDGDDVMRSHVLNAIMRDCPRDRWRFDKGNDPSRKIDGLVAAVFAVRLLLAKPENHLESHGIYI